MKSLSLDPKRTALVLVNLQRGIASRPVEPYSAQEVVAHARHLAEAFRRQGSPVVYVRVDFNHLIPLEVDEPGQPPAAPPTPEAALELVPEAGFTEGDLLVTKRHWSAFGGTDLAGELHARGVEIIVLGGISTNFAVESTARHATSLGLSVVLAEDACSSISAAAHQFACEKIFPRIARVRTTEEIVAALAG